MKIIQKNHIILKDYIETTEFLAEYWDCFKLVVCNSLEYEDNFDSMIPLNKRRGILELKEEYIIENYHFLYGKNWSFVIQDNIKLMGNNPVGNFIEITEQYFNMNSCDTFSEVNKIHPYQLLDIEKMKIAVLNSGGILSKNSEGDHFITKISNFQREFHSPNTFVYAL